MANNKRQWSVVVLLLAASGWLSAQEANPTEKTQQPDAQQAPIQLNGGVPLYRIDVVARDIPAINYFHRQGSTKIGFEGTSLLPGARGWAEVEAKRGRTVVELHLAGLSPATASGLST